jgi:hypothetical protein
MADIADILKKAKRREKSVYLCLAGEEIAELDRLERQLAELGKAWQPGSLADADPREKLAKQVAAARKKVRGAETEFRFRALGDKEWSDLLAAHPSQDKAQMWDPETFGPCPDRRVCGGSGDVSSPGPRAFRRDQSGAAR